MGRQWRSATAMIFDPLPRFVLLILENPFCRGEAPVDEGFLNMEYAADSQSRSECLQNSSHHTGLDPLLGIGDDRSGGTDIDQGVQPRAHPCVTPIRYRSELPAAPSKVDLGRHVAWLALGLGDRGSSIVGL